MDKIRILIADDHAVVREGTRRILEQEPDMEVVAEASDGEATVNQALSCKPDVAIVDIAIPFKNREEHIHYSIACTPYGFCRSVSKN